MIASRLLRSSLRRGLLTSPVCTLSQRQSPLRSFHATYHAQGEPLTVPTQNVDGLSRANELEGHGNQGAPGQRPETKRRYTFNPAIVNELFKTDKLVLRIKETGENPSFRFVARAADSSESSAASSESHELPSSTAARKSEPRRQKKTVTSDWLREACRCSKCADPNTMQRKFNVLKPGGATEISHVVAKPEGFEITWNKDHVSYYDNKWLMDNLFWDRKSAAAPDVLKRGLPSKVHFGSDIQDPPRVGYFDIIDGGSTSNKGMFELLQNILSRGFCLVTETPKTPEATQTLLERVGPIRNTHYGGFYDFQPNLEYGDTAYTNEALDVHTDTTYFTEPAGLQAFHLLSHYPPPGAPEGAKVLGGETQLVDGFKAAAILADEDPDSYAVLSQMPIPWHASGNEDVAITPMKPFPVLESTKSGRLFRIRWNNDDRGVINPQHIQLVEKWYAAAALWSEILQRPANVYNFQLQPGTALIFDNWRVLHGRTAFEGARRMCGAYVSRDDAISRWKISGYPREDVIGNNMRLHVPTV